MMDMYRRLLLNKERMMINEIIASIEMEEPRDIFSIWRIQNIRRLEREISRIKLVRLFKVRNIRTEMS